LYGIKIREFPLHHGTDPDEAIIYANKGKSTSWTKQVLWEGGSHSCRIFDCDNDGDLDFFGANYQGTEVNLWVNETIHPKPLSLDKWSYIQSVYPEGIGYADLDEDGDIDLCCTSDDLDIVSIGWNQYPYLHLWRDDAIQKNVK
jgi:hypothetical protein